MPQPESTPQDLPGLSERQERILAVLVQSYCEHPEAISSQHLADHSDLNVSAATIRNEMAILEQHGYIVAPHPSRRPHPYRARLPLFRQQLAWRARTTTARATTN